MAVLRAARCSGEHVLNRPRRPAAFIDRDGVINEERDYVHRIEDFHLLPGAVDGLRILQQRGYALVVITNQAGIARGYYTEADFARLSEHMQDLLLSHGVHLDGIYHCPHHPTAGKDGARQDCACRKPRPGMLLHAARDLDLSLPDSVLVGDKTSDIEAGRSAGVAACALVKSGHSIGAADEALADHCGTGLLEAARWIVSRRN